MEERLFFIGLAMGAYAWLSKKFKESQALDSSFTIGLWHGAFLALAGFSITIVLVMSFESRARFVVIAANVLSTTELYASLGVALAGGLIGFWRGNSQPYAPSTREYFLNEDAEWSETVFSAVLLAAVLMYFVIQAFKIPSGSMERTLLIGDHLFVNKFIYGLRVPISGKRVMPMRKVQRGDIVVFRFPVDDPRELHCGSVQFRKDFIKRVIALPGETVEVRAGVVFIDGKKLEGETYAQYLDGPNRQPPAERGVKMPRDEYQKFWQTHQLDRELNDVQKDFFGPVTVPPDSVFAMGDNRDRSCDSRYWGPIESKYLKGKAWFIYWPPSRMRVVR
jgi:signal peptidase I